MLFSQGTPFFLHNIFLFLCCQTRNRSGDLYQCWTHGRPREILCIHSFISSFIHSTSIYFLLYAKHIIINWLTMMATNKKIELEVIFTYLLASKSRCPCILAPPLIYTSSHSSSRIPSLSITLLGCAFSHPFYLWLYHLCQCASVLQKDFGVCFWSCHSHPLNLIKYPDFEIVDNMGGPLGRGVQKMGKEECTQLTTRRTSDIWKLC